MNKLENITAFAQTPDQLIPYVSAVSSMRSQIIGEAVLHTYDNFGVLVAFSPHDPYDSSVMNKAVDEALTLKEIDNITVLGPEIPSKAPKSVKSVKDLYWGLMLEETRKSSKLRNMLKRAAKEIEIEKSEGKGTWTKEHVEICADFCRNKKDKLSEDSIFLFGQIGKYLDNAPEAKLFSARDKRGKLRACAIGDFSAFATAFYMFAFRFPDAPPGSADLLLDAIVNEAINMGYERLNLGLGINEGVEFFKRKWGAAPFFPYVESKWKTKGWLSRFLG